MARSRSTVVGLRDLPAAKPAQGEARYVWAWIVRDDGGIEEHIGPLGRWLRDPSGKIVQRINPDTGEPEALADHVFAADVAKALLPFDGQNAREVGLALRKKDLAADPTGALRKLATGLLSVAQRVTERQRRAELSVVRTQIDGSRESEPMLRAIWLADFELAQMTVHVRAE